MTVYGTRSTFTNKGQNGSNETYPTKAQAYAAYLEGRGLLDYAESNGTDTFVLSGYNLF